MKFQRADRHALRELMMARVSVLVLASMTLGQAALAAERIQTAAVEEVVVTAARTILPPSALPMTVDVVDATSLAEQVTISGSIIDAISTLSPSFSPSRQKLSGAGETLRGRSPLFAINGIPQSTPIRDGSRDGYTIDAFFIDRVELIYGSNALQGIGATGGVVNQVTVGAPATDGATGRLLLQAGDDLAFKGDSLGGKAAALLGYKAGDFDATVGAAYEVRGAFYDGDGRRIGVDGIQGEIQDSRTLSLFSRFGLQVSETARLDLIANRFELKGDGDYLAVAGNRITGLPASSIRGKQPGIPPANRVETLAISYTDTDLVGGNLVSQVFFNRSRDTFGGVRDVTFQDVRIAPLGTLFDQSSNRSRKLGARASYERAIPGIEGLTSTIGLDTLTDRTQQVLVQTSRVWVPPTTFRSIAPFAQANFALFDGKLRLAGGLRYENVGLKVGDFTTLAFYGSRRVGGGSPEFKATLVNGGAVLEPTKGVRLYTSYAEGYTVPDVGRILRAIARDGVDVDTFLDISPVISNNREIGAEFKAGPLEGAVAYFWSSSKLGSLLVLNNGIFDVQRQRVEIEGLEINATFHTPIPGLDLSAGYAALDGRSDTNADGKVDLDLNGANISPDRLNLAASYRQGRVSARFQVQSYMSRTFKGASDPRDSFEGYTLADAFVRYEIAKGALTLGVQNLFDRQYVSYASDTANPTDSLRFFAGRGRTATLGWDYRF